MKLFFSFFAKIGAALITYSIMTVLAVGLIFLTERKIGNGNLRCGARIVDFDWLLNNEEIESYDVDYNCGSYNLELVLDKEYTIKEKETIMVRLSLYKKILSINDVINVSIDGDTPFFAVILNDGKVSVSTI